ncbi:hypothetical protein GCM10023208_08130 [Erythrobacter westpacificensis]|uniref:Zinc finger CHC2-type domain-containing protein n=1 Tax=Erythrobacter westpacificensis TaxID=1055231 RepID=A0ABP9K4C7_9SPHN
MMDFNQRVYRGTRQQFQPLDLDAIRAQYPLPDVVVGAGAKLRRAGSEWKCCCPLHHERTPSFTIYSGGERFYCFGCGAGGDVLDFVQAWHGVGLREAAALLGEGELPSVSLPPLPANDTNDRSDEALAIWRAAGSVDGTPAETYLRWRGITIEPPPSLRFAVLPYGKSGPDLPCLVCCVSSPEGPLQGIQRVYLAPNGRGKADVPKAKLSLGPVGGGAIRLAPLDGGELVAVAGPEEGLTLLQCLSRPVWAVTGDVMLPKLRFPAEVQQVAIGGDNDASGRSAVAKAASAFAQRGLTVRTFFPREGHKDFNSELMEAAQ